MRTSRFLAGIVLVISSASLLSEETPLVRHERAQQFMRQKLAYSQGILEGLVLQKYELIATNAVLLRNMNLTNSFLALKNPTYLEKMANFQAQVDNLAQAGKDQNLERATDSYSQMVDSCVACHKLFRREQFQRGFAK
jgi:hypothetical protein